MPRPPVALREETLAETRTRLLEAAAAEFAEKGFANANVNHISQTAGFAKGTIYNYFPSKRELMLELIQEIAALHTVYISEQVEAENEPVDRLRSFFSAGFEFVEHHPLQSRAVINAIYGPDRQLAEHAFQAYEDLFSMIMDDILAAGMGSGEFAPGDANLLVALVMSIYLGSCALLGPDGRIWFEPDQVLSFCLNGLRGE
ncbi:MAG: TetR/AcrR family transcriptional regulator [Anaerolineales bacterium]|nr:TetR/AcrR family transcriptional regulator [Anaerolineales bacterium]